MKDVTTSSPVKELTIEELQGTFGGSDDQATVLDGVVIIEDIFI
jgi:hypothetical protein